MKVIDEKYIMLDFSDFSEITQEVVEDNKKRTFTGGVRIQQGMYRTTKEADEYIRKSLERVLP
jgi:hypothetical protein